MKYTCVLEYDSTSLTKPITTYQLAYVTYQSRILSKVENIMNDDISVCTYIYPLLSCIQIQTDSLSSRKYDINIFT